MYTVVTFFDGQGSNLLGHTVVALVLLNNSPLNSRPSAVEISIINSDHVKGTVSRVFPPFEAAMVQN